MQALRSQRKDGSNGDGHTNGLQQLRHFRHKDEQRIDIHHYRYRQTETETEQFFLSLGDGPVMVAWRYRILPKFERFYY